MLHQKSKIQMESIDLNFAKFATPEGPLSPRYIDSDPCGLIDRGRAY